MDGRQRLMVSSRTGEFEMNRTEYSSTRSQLNERQCQNEADSTSGTRPASATREEASSSV